MGRVENRDPPDGVSRHFTVAVFVVADGHVVLHPHRKLGIWLPPGGHIEPHELPDDAALRETREETGLAVRLVGSPGIDHDPPGSPRQLLRPEGVQVEDISADPPHQHIDLIYFATPVADGAPLPTVGGGPALAPLEGGPALVPLQGGPSLPPLTSGPSLPPLQGEDGMEWVDAAGLQERPVTEEVRTWARLALAEVPRRLGAGRSRGQSPNASSNAASRSGVAGPL